MPRSIVLLQGLHVLHAQFDRPINLRPRSVFSRTALTDLYHSNLMFSDFPQLLSVDSSDES